MVVKNCIDCTAEFRGLSQRCPECRYKHRLEIQKKYRYDIYHGMTIEKHCPYCNIVIKKMMNYCRKAPCISATFGSNTRPLKSNRVAEKLTRSEACKRVTCEPLNKYRDMLFEKFMVDFTVEKFNDIRKVAMKGLCGQPIAKGFIGAIFYLMSNLSQYKIAKCIGITEPTIRNYIKKLSKETIVAAGKIDTFNRIPNQPRQARLDSKPHVIVFNTIPIYPGMVTISQISKICDYPTSSVDKIIRKFMIHRMVSRVAKEIPGKTVKGQNVKYYHYFKPISPEPESKVEQDTVLKTVSP